MPIEPGTTLEGRYRIVSLLGEGGMGAVYQATDLRLNQVVALKENLELPDGERRRSTDPTAGARLERVREQFMREARILASLRHPGLPRVLDYFVVPDHGQYLVMDYIEGQDLQVLLAQAGRFSEERVLSIGLELCDVLAYLHGQDPPVIHRDVKPTNVRVTPQGRVVLVDFGVAKEGAGQHTRTAARAVSEGYSPLEQYGGMSKTDARSDVYALGATLYALLSGEAPPAATDRAAGHAVPRLAARLPAASPDLQAVLDRALELKPEERWPTARSFRVALEELDRAPAGSIDSDVAHFVGATTRAAATESRLTVVTTSTRSEEPADISPPIDSDPDSIAKRAARGRAPGGLWVGLLALAIVGVIAAWQIDGARQRHRNEVQRLEQEARAAKQALEAQQRQVEQDLQAREAERRRTEERDRRERAERQRQEALRREEEQRTNQERPKSTPATSEFDAEMKRIYDAAYLDLTKGNYVLAILGFREYLGRAAGSELADNAQYWIGEAFYGQSNFEQAAIEFVEVVSNYPKGDKVPSALLKAAHSYLRVDDLPSAQRYFRRVVEEFPNSDEAELARSKLHAKD